MQPQKIIWPWQLQNWPEIKENIVDFKFSSIVDMDSKISSMHKGKLRPRQLIEMFNAYYAEDAYSVDRISKNDLIGKIIPYMQKLIGDGPKTFRTLDNMILFPKMNINVVFTRPQVATIIACMWFNLFNYNYISKSSQGDITQTNTLTIDEFPEPTFLYAIDSRNMFVLQCVLKYFERVQALATHPDENTQDIFHVGNVIFSRKIITDIHWKNSEMPIITPAIGEGHADDSPVKMITAYAHAYIGGDKPFSGSPTQETVILLTRTECIAALLICPVLSRMESLVVFGAEKISQYVGYGSSIRYLKSYVDDAPLGFSPDNTEVMKQIAVIFIDASNKTSDKAQLKDEFMRDLNKAYCGYSQLKFKKIEQVACGNWTSGFNGANIQVKFIQLLLAASYTNKCLVYYPFSKEFESKLLPFIQWVSQRQLTVGDLVKIYEYVVDNHYEMNNRSEIDLFSQIMDY